MEAVQVQTRDVLDVSGLVRRYGDLTAVDGVSFHIRAGETYGLLGPNGAGKTTIISMVAGLIPADEGTVRVAGRDMTPSETEAKRAIGLVPQELAIYPDLTARENLKFFGRLQGLSRQGAHPAHQRGAGADRPERPCRRPDQEVLRRHEAPAEHRHRPAAPAHPADPGRTDRRGGPAVPQLHPRIRGTALRRRHGGPLHHPLHGGSRAALRPDRDHRRGPDPGRGHPGRADHAHRRGGPDQPPRRRQHVPGRGGPARAAGRAARRQRRGRTRCSRSATDPRPSPGS